MVNTWVLIYLNLRTVWQHSSFHVFFWCNPRVASWPFQYRSGSGHCNKHEVSVRSHPRFLSLSFSQREWGVCINSLGKDLFLSFSVLTLVLRGRQPARLEVLHTVSINLKKLPPITAIGFLKHSGRNWPISWQSFYLAVSISRNDPVHGHIESHMFTIFDALLASVWIPAENKYHEF